MKETKPVLAKVRQTTKKQLEQHPKFKTEFHSLDGKFFLIDEPTLNAQPGTNLLEITTIYEFLTALLNPFALDNNTTYKSLQKLASAITEQSARSTINGEEKQLTSKSVNDVSGTEIDLSKDVVYCLQYDPNSNMFIVARYSADLKFDLISEIDNENCEYGVTHGTKTIIIDNGDKHQIQFVVYRGCNDSLIREISKYIHSIYTAMKQLRFKPDNVGNNISCPPLRSLSYILLQLLTQTSLADGLTYISTNLALIGMERNITVGVLLTLMSTASQVPKPADWKKPELEDNYVSLTALTQAKLRLPFNKALIFRRADKQFVNNINEGMASFSINDFDE